MAATEVFDLDALQAEATGEPFTFRLAGEDFTLPPVKALDRRDLDGLLRAFQGGPAGVDIDAGLSRLLGEQWERFEKLPLSVAQLNGLLEAYQKHEGIGLGE